MGLWTRLFGAAKAPASEPARPSRDDVQRDARIYAEPSMRAYPTWTPSTIKAAELSADGGNMRLAGDLCEWLFKDERISADLHTRVQSILGAELSFEASGDGRRKGRAVKALEAEDDWYAAFPEDEFGQLLKWALALGVAHGQKCWELKGDRLIPRLKFWYPRHLSYRWDERRWYSKVDQIVAGGFAGAGFTGAPDDVPISNRDRYWILHTPFGGSRPWIHGLWKQLSRWALLKEFAVRDWGLHSEVHGLPQKVLKPKEGTNSIGGKPVTAQLRKELANDIAALARNATIALPPGFDYSLVEATANTWEMYQAQIDIANRAISICILGQNMTTEGKANQQGVTGAREVRQDTKESDERTTTTLARTQVLEDWADLNYGDPELAPWPHWNVEPPEDAGKLATTWYTIAQAKDLLRKNDADLDNKQLEERFNMPLVEHETPEPPPPPAPGQLPPPGKDGEPPPTPKAPAKTPAKPEKAKGMVGEVDPRIDDGQRYADRVCDGMVDHGTKGLAPTVAAMLSAVANATSFEEAQALVQSKYEGLATPKQLAALTESALVMTQLGGQLSAIEHIAKDIAKDS